MHQEDTKNSGRVGLDPPASFLGAVTGGSRPTLRSVGFLGADELVGNADEANWRAMPTSSELVGNAHPTYFSWWQDQH